MIHATIIGSCRIHTPMQAIAEQGLLSLDNCGMRGYVHSLSEIAQLVRFVQGKEAISSSILPFIPFECIEDLHRFGPTCHEGTDKFIIEICSIKEFRINGQYVQMNLLFEKMRAYGMEEDYFDFCKRMNNTQGTFCPFLVSSGKIQKEAGNLFSNLEGISLTQEQVFNKIRELHKLVKRPMVLVTHIELDGHEEDPTISLYHRSTGVRFLREAGQLLNISVVEPGLFVKHVGEEILMQSGSTTHYKPEANIIMGRWMFKQFS